MTVLEDRLLAPSDEEYSAFMIWMPDGRILIDELPPLSEIPAPRGMEQWAVPGVTGLGDVAPARPSVSAEIRTFRTAVQGLAAVDVTTRPDVQALVDLQGLLEVGEALRAVQLDRLVDAQTRQLALLDDEVSLRTWIRHRFDDTHRTDLPLAGSLRKFPAVREHVRARDLTVEAAALVTAALGRVKQHVDRTDGLIDGLPGESVLAAVVGHVIEQVAGARLGLPEDHPLLAELTSKTAEILEAGGSQLSQLEQAYVLLGQHIPLNLLKAALLEQTDALLPVVFEENALKAHQKRRLRLTPREETPGGRLVADLDAEAYELLHTALGASARRDPANPDDTTAKDTARKTQVFHENPDDPTSDVEADGDVMFPRSNPERGHDALKLMLQRYLAAGLGGVHDKTPVTVTVTVGADVLEGKPGALPAKGGSGQRIPTSLLRQWWGDATVTALVLTRGLIPLGITHEGRTLTRRERRASQVQHGGVCSGLRCCTPNDPLTSLVPHHVRKFSLFGKTSIGETIWVCPRFHMALHHGRTLPLRDGRWLNENGWTTEPAHVSVTY